MVDFTAVIIGLCLGIVLLIYFSDPSEDKK